MIETMTNSQLADAILASIYECQRAHAAKEIARRADALTDEEGRRYSEAFAKLDRLEAEAKSRGYTMRMTMLPLGMSPWPVSVPALVPENSDTLQAGER